MSLWLCCWRLPPAPGPGDWLAGCCVQSSPVHRGPRPGGGAAPPKMVSLDTTTRYPWKVIVSCCVVSDLCCEQLSMRMFCSSWCKPRWSSSKSSECSRSQHGASSWAVSRHTWQQLEAARLLSQTPSTKWLSQQRQSAWQQAPHCQYIVPIRPSPASPANNPTCAQEGCCAGSRACALQQLPISRTHTAAAAAAHRQCARLARCIVLQDSSGLQCRLKTDMNQAKQGG